MARRGTEQRRLVGQLNIRLPAELRDRVREVARDARVTDAAWVRALVSRTLLTPACPEPPTRRRLRPIPSPDVVAIARLRECVGEAVGILRQVAGLDRARSGARLAEIDGAITRLVSLAATLDDAKGALLGRDR